MAMFHLLPADACSVKSTEEECAAGEEAHFHRESSLAAEV
jgi:hypothetical protein